MSESARRGRVQQAVGVPIQHGPLSRRTNRHTVRWVHDVLRHELKWGAFPDEVLPSEDALVKRYSVSRGTIRRVMELLSAEGLIERFRGAGTFNVSPTVLRHGLNVSRDLAQDVNTEGTRARIFTTHLELRPATDFIAAKLDIPPGDEIVIVETTTYLDGFPLSCRNAFLPIRLFGDRDPEAVDFDRSPYDVLFELTGSRPGDTHVYITAAVADEVVADILGIAPGTPTLDTNRVIVARDGTPLEYSLSRARADRVSFHVLMVAREGAVG